jgi:hypothetical protein
MMTRRKVSHGRAERIDPIRIQLMARIRQAQSWEELIKFMEDNGYTLFPAEEDAFGINFRTRDVIFLGDSGHLFPLLVARLGNPPRRLHPARFRPTQTVMSQEA